VHEFSLAQGLCRQLLQLAGQHGAKKIITVRVEIGRLSGIVVDSFAFGFEVLARENPVTRDAVLEITERDPEYRCPDCRHQAPSTAPAAVCPQCSSERVMPVGGDDLILTQVEME